MITVLLISHYEGLHGAEQTLLTLCSGLRNEFKFIVVTPRRGLLNKKLSALGIKNYAISINRWIDYHSNLGDLKYCKESVEDLLQLIKTHNVDIVHTNTSILVEGALAAREAGIPHIWHLHEFLENHPSLECQLPIYFTYKFIEVFSERIIVVSQALGSSVSRFISSDKIQVIPNGIYPARPKGNIHRKLNLATDQLVVTNIGGIVKEKGCENLVNSAIDICNSYPKVVFLVVGPVADIDLNKRLTKQVETHSLSNRILFLGYRNDVSTILEGTDIYVCSSLMETFSLSIIEAMSFGKPVISTRCGGPEEIVDHGRTGLLVPVDDVNEMVCAIKKLIESTEMRVSFGENGNRKYLNKYTPESYLQAFKKLYESIGPPKAPDAEVNRLAAALIKLLEPEKMSYVENDRLYDGTTTLQGEKERLYGEKIHEMLNSRSWRITAPLRIIHDYLRRLRS